MPAVDDPVGAAMEVLLSKRQIAFIKSQTFRGPSRKEVLRQMLNVGMALQEKRDQEIHKAVGIWLRDRAQGAE